MCRCVSTARKDSTVAVEKGEAKDGLKGTNQLDLGGFVLEGDVLRDEVLSFDDGAAAPESPRPNHSRRLQRMAEKKGKRKHLL